MSLLAMQTVMAAPAFTNAGFEDNGPAYNTGYNTFKTPVAGWSIIGSSGEAGVMYYTNDAFTSGTGYKSQIAGMRMGKGISQTVSGFTPGQNYRIKWEGNSRIAYGDGWLRITAGGHIVWGDSCPMRSSFINFTSYVFRATGTNVTIQFQNPLSDDFTTLLDYLAIISTTNPVGPFVDVLPVAKGGTAIYTSSDAGYGVPPYDGYTQLRMQFAGYYTMTIREMRRRWKYTMSFYARNRGGSLNDYCVKIDGTNMFGGTNYTATYTWENKQFEFTANSTTGMLTFQTFCTGGGDRTVFFDGFSVIPIGPENVGFCLMIR